jgi:hypothetical protein
MVDFILRVILGSRERFKNLCRYMCFFMTLDYFVGVTACLFYFGFEGEALIEGAFSSRRAAALLFYKGIRLMLCWCLCEVCSTSSVRLFKSDSLVFWLVFVAVKSYLVI